MAQLTRVFSFGSNSMAQLRARVKTQHLESDPAIVHGWVYAYVCVCVCARGPVSLALTTHYGIHTSAHARTAHACAVLGSMCRGGQRTANNGELGYPRNQCHTVRTMLGIPSILSGRAILYRRGFVTRAPQRSRRASVRYRGRGLTADLPLAYRWLTAGLTLAGCTCTPRARYMHGHVHAICTPRARPRHGHATPRECHATPRAGGNWGKIGPKLTHEPDTEGKRDGRQATLRRPPHRAPRSAPRSTLRRVPTAHHAMHRRVPTAPPYPGSHHPLSHHYPTLPCPTSE